MTIVRATNIDLSENHLYKHTNELKFSTDYHLDHRRQCKINYCVKSVCFVISSEDHLA